MTIRATTPTLRSYLGALSSQKTTSTSTNRGLYSLTGGLTENDQAVEDVVNALVDIVDAMPEETITRGKTSVTTDIFSYTLTASTTETAWSLDIGSGVSAVYQFFVHVAAVSDDGLDFSSYIITYSVYWNGTTVSQIAAAVVGPNDETSPASSAATMDVSGTTVRLRVGVTADWRFGGQIQITKVAF